jgi:hypothetical protein
LRGEAGRCARLESREAERRSREKKRKEEAERRSGEKERREGAERRSGE